MLQQQVVQPKSLTESQRSIVDALKVTDFKCIGKVSEFNEQGKLIKPGDKALDLLKAKLERTSNNPRASLDDLEKEIQSNQSGSREDRLMSAFGSIREFQNKAIDQMESADKGHPKRAEVEALLSGVSTLTDTKSEFTKALNQNKLSPSQKESIIRAAVQDIYLKANEIIESKDNK